jgi:VWFA-related protein
MNTRNRLRTLVLPLLAGAAVAAAQHLDPQEVRLSATSYIPRPAVTIQAEARLVEVGVVVRDSRGHSVGGLTKSDFEVRDEGKRREISAFSVQSFTPAKSVAAGAPAAAGAASTPAPSTPPQPRWVGMVFDDLSMPMSDLYHAKTAAKRFLQTGLAANDRVGVFTISGGLVLPFTADVAQIAAAIDKVYLRERTARLEGCPVYTGYDAYVIANNLDPTALQVKAQEYANCNLGTCSPPGGGHGRGSSGASGSTACPAAILAVQATSRMLWDEVRLQSENTLRTLANIVDFMTPRKGTRVLLLASSGVLSGTLEDDENQLVDKALRANVVINSLDAKGLYTLEPVEMSQGADVRSVIYQMQLGSRPKEIMNDAMGNLADSTGGLYFHNSNDLDLGFRELGIEPEVSYLLGFVPGALDAKYHRLKVSLTGTRHTTVQARKGYVAAPEKPAAKLPAERRIEKEVFSASRLEEAPVTVAVSSGTSTTGRPAAQLTFHVNIGNVQFHDRDGARAQTFHIIAALLDAQGAFVAGREATMELALKEATYARMVTAGLNANMNLEAPAGSYQARTVVVEGDENGRYSTATQPAEIR